MPDELDAFLEAAPQRRDEIDDFLDSPTASGPSRTAAPAVQMASFLPRAGAEIGTAFGGGALGREQYSGFSARNVAEELGQNIGEIAGGAIAFAPGAAKGAAIGTAVAGPTGTLPGAIIGGAAGLGLGAAAGRLAQTGAQNIGALAGSGVPIRPVGEALQEAGAAGALNAAGGLILPLAGKAVGVGAREFAKRGSQLISGATAEGFERLVQRPKEVLSAISRDPDSPRALADTFKAAVDENLSRASQAYDGIIEKVLSGGKYGEGFRLDLRAGLGDKLAAIQKEFGYGLPGRLGSEGAEADLFNRINKTLQSATGATPEQAYYLQRDINNLARDNKGTTLGAALGKVQRAIRDYLGERIPEIGEANAVYRPAIELAELAEKKLGQQDMPRAVAHAYRRNTTLKDELEKIADGIPQARQALEAMRDAIAGQEFAPLSAPLVRTGLTAGIGALGLTAAAGNPLALAGAAATAPFLSPRLTGLAIGGAARLSRAVPSVAQLYTGPAQGQALEEAYRRLAPAR